MFRPSTSTWLGLTVPSFRAVRLRGSASLSDVLIATPFEETSKMLPTFKDATFKDAIFKDALVGSPGRPVAHNFGLLCFNHGLMAHSFGRLGFPGRRDSRNSLFWELPCQTKAVRG